MTDCKYINGVSGVKCKVYIYETITKDHKDRFCYNMTDEKFLPGTNIRKEQCYMIKKLDELVELRK